VLDASAGIGLDAVWLARQGFRTSACDLSPAMVVSTEACAESAGVDVDVRLADWRSLSSTFAPRSFDAILCTGNSISHLDRQAMPVALREFATLLAPGGILLVDTHDWPQVVAAGDRLVLDPELLRRAGRRCRRSYRWSIAHGAGEPTTCRLAFVLEVSAGSVTRVTRHEVSFEAFTASEFLERIRRAGLRVEYCDARRGVDRYTVVARRPTATRAEVPPQATSGNR
jgi:SAM-dependent methyltransferase